MHGLWCGNETHEQTIKKPGWLNAKPGDLGLVFS
jgi:hypothetical protein